MGQIEQQLNDLNRTLRHLNITMHLNNIDAFTQTLKEQNKKHKNERGITQ